MTDSWIASPSCWISSRRRDVTNTSGASDGALRNRDERRGIVLPYCHNGPGANHERLNLVQGAAPSPTVTIIIGMRPENIGRVLGIGVRVAGRVAGQRLADTRP